MSNHSSPYHSGYASPLTVPTPPLSKPGSSRNTPKPTNVFTNDGSFLERIQRSKREDEEKRNEKEAIERKKNFDNRFKNRGKRPPPEPTPTEDTTNPTEAHLVKKAKKDETSTRYERQLKTFENHSGMKGTGTGIRPLIK